MLRVVLCWESHVDGLKCDDMLRRHISHVNSNDPPRVDEGPLRTLSPPQTPALFNNIYLLPSARRITIWKPQRRVHWRWTCRRFPSSAEVKIRVRLRCHPLPNPPPVDPKSESAHEPNIQRKGAARHPPRSNGRTSFLSPLPGLPQISPKSKISYQRNVQRTP